MTTTAVAGCCLAWAGDYEAAAQTTPASTTLVAPAEAAPPAWYQRVGEALHPGTWVERLKVMQPVWVREERQETVNVRRPVVETTTVQQPVTVYRPTVTYQPQLVDQGGWTEQQVVRPGRSSLRLRWVGGWTTDANTGRTYWRLPLLRPVREQEPDRVETLRVWQPDPQWVQIPQTTMTPQTEYRDVAVQSIRYVDEQQTRTVPVMTQQWQEQEIVREHPCGSATCDPCNAGAIQVVPQQQETPQPELDPRYRVPPPGVVPEPVPDPSPSDVPPPAYEETWRPSGTAPRRTQRSNDEPLDPHRVAYHGKLVPLMRAGE